MTLYTNVLWGGFHISMVVVGDEVFKDYMVILDVFNETALICLAQWTCEMVCCVAKTRSIWDRGDCFSSRSLASALMVVPNEFPSIPPIAVFWWYFFQSLLCIDKKLAKRQFNPKAYLYISAMLWENQLLEFWRWSIRHRRRTWENTTVAKITGPRTCARKRHVL